MYMQCNAFDVDYKEWYIIGNIVHFYPKAHSVSAPDSS